MLVQLGLSESRERAQRLIRAGVVLVAGERVDKPGRPVDSELPITIKQDVCPYVSRGGLKLAGALERFGLTALDGITALDIGASTGGFTDCLLRHGAARVWAVDTGRGQLHETLRTDPRVHLRERANARNLEPSWVEGEPVQLITVDVSFISVGRILPAAATVLAPEASAVVLIKPQFEAGRQEVGRGGVVKDRAVHEAVLRRVTEEAQAGGWRVLGVCPSPIAGPAGNLEFFAWLDRGGPRQALNTGEITNAIEQALAEAYNSVSKL